jgi:hypothetical protein
MSVHVRQVTLDSAGHAIFDTPPGYYMGAVGGGVSSVTSTDGEALGTAVLARGSGVPVRGINVSGDSDGEVTLYFAFT